MKLNSIALLIQTLLSHGKMDYRVFIEDTDGKLREVVVVSGTDYPARVILKPGAVVRR